ncbi:MAG: diguanylate cyclase [Eubacteriaceae bacterium]|nr:diguanylate cyclase [Eubacteriaceae bacterium]
MNNLRGFDDAEGHNAGDRMIRYFAEMLRHSTRKGDILCRYGGDEFVVILKRINQELID